jgi:hypothetical protein
MGKSGEDREMLLVVVTNAENMSSLQKNKELMAKLADPRVVKTEKDADAIIAQIKPVYWLTQNLHSPESGSSETCMELAYRLAVDEGPFFKKIRDNVIVLISPSIEPDGHDKHTDWFYKYDQDVMERSKVVGVPYWGKYDRHDNNRDMITMSQVEMQNIAKTYYEWHPVVLQDNHEIGYLFYVSSSNGPSNFPPSMGGEANQIAWFEVTQMTAWGMPGVYTHAFGNTMWSPNFMASVASNHNSVFHFYETLGNAIANTMEREMPEGRNKEEWYRPLAPPDKFLWSLRNNVNYQQTGDLLAFYVVASYGDFYLKNFWRRGFDSYQKGMNEPPYAYVIPAGQKDPVDTAFLVNVLLKQKIEVHKTNTPLNIEERSFPGGSYVVKMDQPYRNLAVNLFGIQQYPQDPGTTRVYDDAGWTLGLHMDVETVEIKDKAIFDASLVPVAGPVKPKGEVIGGNASGAYVINHGTINSLLTARFTLKDFEVLAAEAPFKVGDKDFDAGSWIIPVSGASDKIHQAAQSVAGELGLEVIASPSVPDVKAHDLDIPRIAVYHTWHSTQDDGWVRFALDELNVPYAYINKDHVRAGNLKSKYDVILFSNCGGRSGASIVNGLDPAKRGPLAYVKSEEFKHLGTPDSAEDITGGMGIDGVGNLQKFAEEGGLLVVLHNPVRVAVDYGMVRGISLYNPSPDFQMAGSLLKGEVVNSKHPIAYGYDKEPPLYRRHSGPLVTIPEDMEKHIVLRYAKEGEVCLSGMVKNEKDLQGKAAIVDVPVGKGHIILFTFNPFWRDTSHGAYMFVFNAILNFNDLGVGKAEKATY